MTRLTHIAEKSPPQAPRSRLECGPALGQAWRIDISVEPDWFNIAAHCADLDRIRPERRRWSDALRRLPREGAPCGAKAGADFASGPRRERGDGLIGESFFYSLFHDGLTGLNHLWSHGRRGFVDGWAVAGPLFPSDPASVWEIRNRYCLLPCATDMAMRLGVIDESLVLAVGPGEADGGLDRVLASFPLEETLLFFLRARQKRADVMRRVKRFAPELSARLDEAGFSYAAWVVQGGSAVGDEECFDSFAPSPSFLETGLSAEDDAFSSDRVMSHGFLSPYLSVVMRLEFYGP